jgi:hypothetical protein
MMIATCAGSVGEVIPSRDDSDFENSLTVCDLGKDVTPAITD